MWYYYEYIYLHNLLKYFLVCYFLTKIMRDLNVTYICVCVCMHCTTIFSNIFGYASKNFIIVTWCDVCSTTRKIRTNYCNVLLVLEIVFRLYKCCTYSLHVSRGPPDSYFLRLLENGTRNTIKPKIHYYRVRSAKISFFIFLGAIPSSTYGILQKTHNNEKNWKKKNRAIGYLWYTPGILFTSTVVTTTLPRPSSPRGEIHFG